MLNQQSLLATHMYLPLCCKPKTSKLLEKEPQLLEESIRRCLRDGEAVAGDAKLLIFIADSDIMAKANVAMGMSEGKANRLVERVAVELKEKVDTVLKKLRTEVPELADRIAGCVHWREVEKGALYQRTYNMLRDVMHGEAPTEDLQEGYEQLRFEVKSLVKNLLTQRVTKARATGSKITNCFTGNGLELREEPKHLKRYLALETSCLMELSIIMSGLEYKGRMFTEMHYMNTDARGMTFIARCLQAVRRVLIAMPLTPDSMHLKMMAAQCHGIELLNYRPKPSSTREKPACTKAPKPLRTPLTPRKRSCSVTPPSTLKRRCRTPRSTRGAQQENVSFSVGTTFKFEFDASY